MRTQTKEIQENLTPKSAHEILVKGNERFAENLKAQRNLIDQVFATSKGQYPFAVILSCIDSRVPAELVFDQGIGDIFSVRVAGNVVNEDVLGSMEYACKVAGSKIVVVMGHTKCGAVTAACNNVELGNITPLLNKIKPHQVFLAGDLEDPNGTHRICLDILLEALKRLNISESWMKDCYVWMYRGTWYEWPIHEIDMAVPLSPQESIRKRQAIIKHKSQSK